MTQVRRFRPAKPDRRSPNRSPQGLRGILALGVLALALAGCGSRSGPASQPLDVGLSAPSGLTQRLAGNGDHERLLLPPGLSAQPGGDMLTNGARPGAAGPMVPGPVAAAPQQLVQQAPAVEDPTQPSAAEPLLDAGGFDPSPQGGGEIDHGANGGDSAAAPGLH